MSNVLKVSLQTTIYTLVDRGWSQRRIAKELGINRETVGRYLRLAKPANSTAGKNGGCKSQCEPLIATIAAKVEVGLSAQRIYQDLVEENGFSDSYESVKRFVRKLQVRQPERVWRLECRPGEEVQVDFGLGAPIEDGRGKVRRSWVFRMVFSYSRKAYSEAVSRQDTETFLRCAFPGEIAHVEVIGATGFEPATSCSQSRRSTKLATPGLLRSVNCNAEAQKRE